MRPVSLRRSCPVNEPKRASIFWAKGSLRSLVWLIPPWGPHDKLGEVQQDHRHRHHHLLCWFRCSHVRWEHIERFWSHRNNVFMVKTLECSFFDLFATSGGTSLWWTQRQTNYMTGAMSNIVGIPMPFSRQGVCLIPYCGPMPYTMQFPAYRIGGWVEPCLIRGYALSEVCLKRVSTVL